MMLTRELCGDEMFSREIDVEEYQPKKDHGRLASLRTLKEALARFGYREDDVIGRRDAVSMFRKIESAFRAEIAHLTACRRYDEAKHAEDRLTALHEAFCDHQMGQERRVMDRQQSLFRKAKKAVHDRTTARHAEHREELEAECTFRERDLQASHAAQTENLHLDIENFHEPRFKASKYLLELTQAELSLVRLRQYDDAKNVRRMMDRIEPGERAAWRDQHQAAIKHKLDSLDKKQKEELKNTHERVSADRWRGIRHRQRDARREAMRVGHHDRDMAHTHTLVLHRKPELSVKPSANWKTRRAHTQTSSHFRGEQLLDFTNGKQQDQSIFVQPLCDIHDFDQPASGTTRLF